MLPCLTSGLQPDLGVALVAIHRSALSGLEGYLRVFTTLGAYSRKHFPLPLIAIAIPIALLSPGRSAFGTTLGLIGKAPGSKQLLLICAKSETDATIRAFEGLLYVVHGQPPFLYDLVSAWSSMAQGTREESHRLGKTYFEPDVSGYHRIEHSVKLLPCDVPFGYDWCLHKIGV